MNTMLFFVSTALITASVNSCQPKFELDPGFPGETVKHVFKRRTPWFAKFVRSPEDLSPRPRSYDISVKMFFNEGGFETSL